MKYIRSPLFILLGALAIGSGYALPAFAAGTTAPASFSAARSLIATSSSSGNSYVGGASVIVTAPVTGDLSAIGGEIIAASPVGGDELLLGGSIVSRAPVAGDVRTVGGSISLEQPIGGDLVAAGLSVHDTALIKGSVFVTALDAALQGGARGAVIVYGNTVSLGGDFAGNVTVTASGQVTLAPNTVIHGTFSYESPEMANIPSSATVVGGVHRRAESYLPNAGTSRVLAFVGVGLFLFVRILGMLILAGLLAGLFPTFARALTTRTYEGRTRTWLLTFLLGFAVFAATPILLAVLALTFVGLGIALLLFITYALLVFLAFVYAGILIGCAIMRRVTGRQTVLWRDGVLGMLVLSLCMLIPVIGLIIALILTIYAAGALLLIFFTFAFPGGTNPLDVT